MSHLSAWAITWIISGTISAVLFIIYTVAACFKRGAGHTDDHQELPSYSKNCPPENTGQELGVIQDHEAHLAEQNDESFDEDTRTIVGEENESNNSLHGAATDNSQGLSGSNGHKMKDQESLDGEDRTITGEERDVTSVGLTERGYPGERYGVIDDGPVYPEESWGGK